MDTIVPKTRMGRIANGGNGSATGEGSGTKLGRLTASGRRGEDVTLPLLGPARIELLGATETQEVEAEVYRAMRTREIDLNGVTAERFELERAVRTLARAVRDPSDRALAFGTVVEWGCQDNDVINGCWQLYGDVRERLDPMALALTDEDRVLIEIAVKKKDAQLLRSFGVVKLSAWLASMDGLLSTSPPPSSSSSDSSSAP